MWLMKIVYFKPIRYHTSATTDWLGIIHLFRDAAFTSSPAMSALNRDSKNRHQKQKHFFQTPNASGSDFDLACSRSSSEQRGFFLICASTNELGPLLKNAENVNVSQTKLTFTSSDLFLRTASWLPLISATVQFSNTFPPIQPSPTPQSHVSGTSESKSCSITFLVLHDPTLISQKHISPC